MGSDVVHVWPENWQAYVVFNSMRTQWRAGGVGLDYGALPEVWRRTKTPISDRDEIFQAIRVMEDAALEEIHKGE